MDLEFPVATSCHREQALLKLTPADFQVSELFEPPLDESGEHCYLLVRKTDSNTQWVAELLAQVFNVKPLAVGFCGLKDRRAVTTQWFSVLSHDPDQHQLAQVAELSNGMVEVLNVARGTRKLRRGMHSGNEFKIRLVFANPEAARQAAGAFDSVVIQGAPNYFGTQRFGSNGNNLQRAAQQFQGRNLQGRNRRPPPGMVISAARSWLFNLVLAERVRNGSWNAAGAYGEPAPSGPLWGRGRNPVGADLQAFEQECLRDYGQWCLGLEHCGLSFERRPLVNQPEAASATVDGHAVWFEFRLNPGCFATTLLDECAVLRLPERQEIASSSTHVD